MKATIPTYKLLLLLLLLFSAACNRSSQPTTPPSALPTADSSDDATTDPIIPTATPLPDVTPSSEPATPTDPVDPTAEPTSEPLLDKDWEPQLVYSSPALGEETALDGAITLRFDQAMDQASVEEAFEIDGDVTGAFVWTRPDTVVFTPQANLQRNATYSVRIANTARALNGKTLRDTLALEFETVGFLEVSRIIPADGVDEIAIDSAITVLFNRPVVPLVSTTDQADLPNPLSFSPAIEGAGTWVGTSIYRFEPVAMAGATVYRVTVDAGLEDIVGGVMEEAFSAEFTTEPPKAISFQGIENPIKPSDSVSVTFNMPMDHATTEAAIDVRVQNGPPLDQFTFNWNADSTQLGIGSPQFALENTYTLDVANSATSSTGAAKATSAQRRFETYPFPAVNLEQGYPRNGGIVEAFSVPYTNGMNLNFVSPMDWDSIEDQITVEPTPDMLDYRFDGETWMRLEFDLDFTTDYTVTIPATAADIFGNQIGTPTVIAFSTEDPGPFAAFNLPGRIVQVSNAFPTNVATARRSLPASIVYLDQFVGNVPVKTLFTSTSSSSFGSGIPIDDADTVQTLKTFTYSAVDDLTDGVILLGDGAALPNGVYNIWFSIPDLPTEVKERNGWQNSDTMLIVADTNLVLKQTPDFFYVWATDLATGQPVADREVTLYSNYGLNGVEFGAPFATITTDGNGFAQYAIPTSRYPLGTDNVMAVTGEMGSAEFGLTVSTQSQSVDQYQLDVRSSYSEPIAETVYVYTERPLYRPGDTVHVRGWLRDTAFARHTTPTRSQVEIRFGSPDYEQRIPPIPVTVDENGNFTADLVLPEDAPLGGWNTSVNVDGANFSGRQYTDFTVAEFRKPEFTLSVTPDQVEALQDESVDFTISAEYLFGGSAAGLKTDWSLNVRQFEPQRDGPYYSFGLRTGFIYDPFGSSFYGQFIDSGSAELDETGTLSVSVTPDMLSAIDDASMTLTLVATIQDVGGAFVQTEGSMVLHSAETYVGIRPASYFTGSDEPFTVDLLTTDWDGAAAGNASVDVVFAERNYESRNDPTSPYGITWEAVDTEVAQETGITTDANGAATASFIPGKSGLYVATATVTDAAGRSHSSRTLAYVVGNNASWRFDAADRKMELSTDASDYVVGDTAQILVQSPFDVAAEAWLTIERGNIIEQRIVTVPAGGGLVDVPISAEHIPNVFVSITAIRPVSDAGDRPWADIRYGVVELIVDPAPFAFDIAISTASDQYGPRDTVTYEIETTDANGQPVSADVALALVDLAILTLKADESPALLDIFYARELFRSRIASGLFNSAEGIAADVNIAPPGGFGGGGGGGGGFFSTDTALDLEREGDGVRSDFRDTAFWQATVTTDANGRASIDVTLPDNLTTWRMTARGLTSATQVGEAVYDIVASKSLLIRPVTPRFFTYGDRVDIAAVVNNNSDNAFDASVQLEASGLTFDGDAAQTVRVPAKGSTLVRWPVTVDDVDAVDMTFRVTAGDLSDATKPTISQGDAIPVYRYDAEDIVATAGALFEENRRVEAVLLPDLLNEKRGELTVNLSPSIAAATLDSLEAFSALNDEIYRCPFGISLHLLPNVRTRQSLSAFGIYNEQALYAELEQLIEEQTDQLLDRQLRSGGWAWCDSQRANEYVTAMVLHALLESDLVETMPQDALLDAVLFVRNSAEVTPVSSTPYNADRVAYYLYVLSLADEYPELVQPDVADKLTILLNDARTALSPSGLALVLLAYDNVGSEAPDYVASDLASAVVLSATGAHWEGGSMSNFSSDVRTTATVVHALAQTNPDNPLVPNAMRWLMSMRSGRQWRSPVDTAWTISAATNYMLSTDELYGDYAYTLRVNGGLQADGGFNSDNITSVEPVSIPLADLDASDVNFLDFSKEGAGVLYYTAFMDAFVDANSVEAVNRGFHVERQFYRADCDASQQVCEPLTTAAVGDEVRVELTIVARNNRNFVQIEVPLPAGADAQDPNLDTVSNATQAGQVPNFQARYWGWWFFERIEFRDQKVVFIADNLPGGTYQYQFNMQMIVSGEYQVSPAVAKESARPEVFGRSSGTVLTITP